MKPLIYAVISSFIVSLISFVGIFTLMLRKEFLESILLLLICFSAGALLGGAGLHLIPEAVEMAGPATAAIYVIIGMAFFYALEKLFYWHHCRDGNCSVRPFSYLNLIGDAVHNFTDGLVLGASYVVDTRLGILTTLIVILHEIPQEMGDFGVLVYGGFGKERALFFNFLSALTAVAGALIGAYFGESAGGFSSVVLPFTAGGFIYISTVDLIPEIIRQSTRHEKPKALLVFILGLGFMILMKLIHSH